MFSWSQMATLNSNHETLYPGALYMHNFITIITRLGQLSRFNVFMHACMYSNRICYKLRWKYVKQVHVFLNIIYCIY